MSAKTLASLNDLREETDGKSFAHGKMLTEWDGIVSELMV